MSPTNSTSYTERVLTTLGSLRTKAFLHECRSKKHKRHNFPSKTRSLRTGTRTLLGLCACVELPNRETDLSLPQVNSRCFASIPPYTITIWKSNLMLLSFTRSAFLESQLPPDFCSRLLWKWKFSYWSVKSVPCGIFTAFQGIEAS